VAGQEAQAHWKNTARDHTGDKDESTFLYFSTTITIDWFNSDVFLFTNSASVTIIIFLCGQTFEVFIH